MTVPRDDADPYLWWHPIRFVVSVIVLPRLKVVAVIDRIAKEILEILIDSKSQAFRHSGYAHKCEGD